MLFDNMIKYFQIRSPAFYKKKCVSVTTMWVLALTAPYKDA